MRRVAGGLAALLLLASIVGCAGMQKQSARETIVILMTSQGDITLRFFADLAPEHVANFVAHSESGYFVGTTFHRVIPGFVIQGGDPNTKDEDPDNDGEGGSSYKGEGLMLEPEFSARPHRRGILSMARAEAPNSAGSQFFICQADVPQLDNRYTVFGEVIDGMRVVDKIVSVERDQRDRPLEPQRIEGVRVDTWTTKKVESTREAMWKRLGAS